MKKFWHWPAWGVRACAGLMLFSSAVAIQSTAFQTAAIQAEPRESGFNELVVYAPGTMDREIPGIDLVRDPDLGWQADIQPTLHVHRYYYNGDKEYQAKLLQAGPTIVSVCHPRTGKRLYAQVNLPSGAPIIVYEEDSLTYVYTKTRVVLSFKGDDGHEEVVMTYKNGRGLFRVKHEHAAKVAKKHEESCSRISLKRTVKDASKSVHDTVKGAAGTATEVTSAAVTRVKDTFSTLPGIKQLQGVSEDAASRANTESLQQAAGKAKEQATEFEKTIR